MTVDAAAGVVRPVQAGTVRSRAAGRDFPLRLRRQTTAGPPAIRIGFEPRDIRNGTMRFQFNPTVEVPSHPTAFGVALPIDWRPHVLAIFQKPSVLGLRHRGPSDLEIHNFNGVTPFFVVEY